MKICTEIPFRVANSFSLLFHVAGGLKTSCQVLFVNTQYALSKLAGRKLMQSINDKVEMFTTDE